MKDKVFECGESYKKELLYWVEKIKKFDSVAYIENVLQQWTESTIYKQLSYSRDKFEQYRLSRFYYNFLLWNCVQYIQTDKEKDIFMQYLSQYTCASTIVRELCTIWNPIFVLEHYTDKRSVQRQRLKNIVNGLQNNTITLQSKVAYFDETSHFYVEQSNYRVWDIKISQLNGLSHFETYKFFESFDEFIDYRKGNLTNTDLSGVIDLRCKLNDYKIDETTNLPSFYENYRKKVFNNYENYILDTSKIVSYKDSEVSEKNTLSILNTARTNISVQKQKDNIRVYYLSDLHLLHKLVNEKGDVLTYIIKLVKQLKEDINYVGSPLLFVGDISSDFYVFELFVKVLRENISAIPIIFVLGNHELWSFSNETLTTIYAQYEQLLKRYNMYLLQNNILYQDSLDVCICDDALEHLEEIPTQKLEKLSESDLYSCVKTSPIVLFGGTAFSGFNKTFNAENGIYRGIINREQEIKESYHYKQLYEKVNNALKDKECIVATHTPMDCWSDTVEYNPNFIYVSGHTHHNCCIENKGVRAYADNQIGYYNNNIHLKWFDLVYKPVDFDTYIDGIYTITREEYILFYRQKVSFFNFNRPCKTLYMLKRNGFYCFILENTTGMLNILNGGAIKRLKYKDIQYYYDNMDKIIKLIKCPLNKYMKVMKSVATEVKKLGGDGTIHGSIVDIDFYNHIYVNPIDMKLTGYYATDIVNKIVFPSIPLLLEQKCPDLYVKYERRLKKDSNAFELITKEKSNELVEIPQVYLSTDIYGASREINKMQKLKSKILTMWFETEDTDLLIEQK